MPTLIRPWSRSKSRQLPCADVVASLGVLAPLRIDQNFASGSTVWSSRTFSDPVRFSPVVTPFPLSVSLSNQGSFPPPALPGLRGTTSPSATLPARPAPRGVPVGMCAPPTGLPVLLPPPSSMRAAATTPAEPAGAYVAHFPARGSLPRKTGGAASALRVSRPARRSLALRPVWSLGRPRRPVSPKCFRLCRYLHRPLRLLPAGATVAGRDSHPLRDGAFPRHTVPSAWYTRPSRSSSAVIRTAWTAPPIRSTAYAHGSGRESLPPDVEVEVRAGERVECSLYVPADGATT